MADREPVAPRRSPVQRIINYFREARAELSRVTWSTREEIIGSTQVILIFALVAMLSLGLIDTVFRFLSTSISR
ncbi:MAG: preprotein translocase subunit SecE [Meiothermus sp.]